MSVLAFIVTLIMTTLATAELSEPTGSPPATLRTVNDRQLTRHSLRRMLGQPSENYNDELEQCDVNCKMWEDVAKQLIENTVSGAHCSLGGSICSMTMGSVSTAACFAVGFGPINPTTWICTAAVGSIWSYACKEICKIVSDESGYTEAAKKSKLTELAHKLAMQMAPMCLTEEEKKNDFIRSPIENPLPDQTRCGLCIKEKDRWLIESCHKCKNPSSIWYSHGAVRACGKPKGLQYGEKCNPLDTCLNCPKVNGKVVHSMWWDAKKYACGEEPKKWIDGTTCFIGTSCRACINPATWWWSKMLVKCGNDPCWGKDTKCYGLHCRMCCNGVRQEWYMMGFGYCK